ncbi:hypothetical protein DL768_004863 [Monosporascus sp. mg162]|nr:hypothetical protein DL768_004863 [Monosporascus sp. mg162]
MVQDSEVALITGGTPGVSLEVAKILSARGWTVHLLDRNGENCESAFREVQNAPSTRQTSRTTTRWPPHSTPCFKLPGISTSSSRRQYHGEGQLLRKGTDAPAAEAGVPDHRHRLQGYGSQFTPIYAGAKAAIEMLINRATVEDPWARRSRRRPTMVLTMEINNKH